MLVIGVTLFTAYNRLPSLPSYWSSKKSRGNQFIKSAISRDIFHLLSSKLYFADPEEPNDCRKTYYIDRLSECLKFTFKVCGEGPTSSKEGPLWNNICLQNLSHEESTFGNVANCDSLSGYVYDIIYFIYIFRKRFGPCCHRYFGRARGRQISLIYW